MSINTMIKLQELRATIRAKSDAQAAAIQELQASGKSEKSMQCMKVSTDFDLLVIDCLLNNEDAIKKCIERLNARYNKIRWLEITKKEYITLLSGDTDEGDLKAQQGKYYKKG